MFYYRPDTAKHKYCNYHNTSYLMSDDMFIAGG